MMHHRAFNLNPSAANLGLGGHGKPGSPGALNTTSTHHHPHGGGGSLAFRQTGVYDGKIAGLYDLEETLGRGHFAVVKLARHVFTGEKVAVKVIDKSKLDEVSKAHLFQEVRCMKLVQHPNVVRLYEVIDTATKLYLILELGDGGDLYDYIMRHDAGLSEQVARDYFRQIVRAITYCHQLHVVHRDLKPENVVFFQKLGVVKLTDFGFSNKFCPGQKLETSCGSLAYSAPEILLGDSYDAPAVDVWSLGVILYMLVCGQAPFQEANDSETLTMIMDCKYSVPDYISKDCKDLIARMLVRTPEKRAILSEISTHPWLGNSKKESLGPETFPLVSREQLMDDDHNLIVQKIVNGNIASKEEIQECLDKNEYNHITATYYLLAERKLRAKRQEAASTGKRPENLPVTQKNLTVSRDNSLNQQQPCLLTVPRTPGDVPQRARKCSIVQEDEEEEDMTSSGREDLTGGHGSLNRRGSRSEGRLNLALQERLVEERFKLQDGKNSPKYMSGTTNVIDRPRTSQITPPKFIITTNPVAPPTHNKHRLGKSVSIPESQVDLDLLNSIQQQQQLQQQNNDTPAPTKVLTEAATVCIPVGLKSNGQAAVVSADLNDEVEDGGGLVGRSWRTMPTPASPSKIVGMVRNSGETVKKSDALLTTDTISEEDSSTPTHQPRPRTYISNNRTGHNPHAHASAGSRAAYEQRRAKFHTKHRTASCSSSDASDDDSEGRKKRGSGHVKGLNGDGVGSSGTGGAGELILDGAKPLQGRRDSHDDSSDSQEPGTGTSATSIRNTSSTNNNSRETNNKTSNTNGNSSGGGSTNTGGRKNTNGSNAMLGRRHKASRRRSGETTRLRESQSLNRITEVQEDTSNQNNTTTNAKPPNQDQQPEHTSLIISTQLSATQGTHLAPKVKGLGVRLLQAAGLNMAATVGLNVSACMETCRRTTSVQQIIRAEDRDMIGGMTGSVSSPGEVGREDGGELLGMKGMGHCSRRDMTKSGGGCGGSEVFTDVKEMTTFDPSPSPFTSLHTATFTSTHGKATTNHSNSCNNNNNSNSSGKKLRLGHLGKYLQLSKRFFIPLPSFFTKSSSSGKPQEKLPFSGNTSPRLYKAQSCGSLTHNRIQQQRDSDGKSTTEVTAITLRPRAVSVVRCYCDINQNDDNANGGTGKLAAAMLVNEMCVHLGQASKCSFC